MTAERQKPPSQRDATRQRKKNLRRSAGLPALIVGMKWVTCPAKERGEWHALLAKALRQMIAKGAPPPTKAELERAKEAIIEGPRRK